MEDSRRADLELNLKDEVTRRGRQEHFQAGHGMGEEPEGERSVGRDVPVFSSGQSLLLFSSSFSPFQESGD